MKETLGIGKLAKEAGVGVETIRFYERSRLLPRPERSSGNYRRYDAAALARLRFIRHAKSLGFTLDEIRRLLRLSESTRSDAGDFHEIAREKIAWIDAKMDEMRSMREILAKAMEACPGHGADLSECPVLALFTGCDHAHGRTCRCDGCAHLETK